MAARPRIQRETFPVEGLWWPYKGRVAFENLARIHLSNFIRQHFPIKDFSTADEVDRRAGREQVRGREAGELAALYLEALTEQVGTVYIFGEPRDLKKVFVELNVVEEYERPLMQAEYLDIMAARLQQQNIFEAEGEALPMALGLANDPLRLLQSTNSPRQNCSRGVI